LKIGPQVCKCTRKWYSSKFFTTIATAQHIHKLANGSYKECLFSCCAANFVLGHFNPGHLGVAITPFKVITDFGTNRKLVCDFLLVINTNLPPILHRFQVMANYWSNFRQRQGGVQHFNALARGDPLRISVWTLPLQKLEWLFSGRTIILVSGEVKFIRIFAGGSAVTWKRCKIRGKLVLITNRKVASSFIWIKHRNVMEGWTDARYKPSWNSCL